MFGSIQSNNTKSISCSLNSNNPSSPSLAFKTSYPSAFKLNDNSSICEGSSSTIRIKLLFDEVLCIGIFDINNN